VTPHAASAAQPSALTLRGIAKRFGPLTALDDAALTVRAGTMHAVLGENGAGKTTLLRAAFGLLRPDAGTMLRNGEPYAPRTPRDAIAAGLGMVHQHYSLVGAMTVAENVVLGQSRDTDARRAAAAVQAAAAQLGFTVDPAARIDQLSVSEQQRVELIKAVARGARVLILDEPTAVLTPAESAQLLQRLRAFADAGGAVVLITHHLREALQHADDITVLRAGRTVQQGSAAALSEEALITAMIGERPPAAPRRTPREPGAVVLAADGAWVADARGVWRVQDATLAVRAGEIVGVAGVDGSGQQELLRLLAGRLAPTRGRVTHPSAVGFVPEDRHRDALLMSASLTDNLVLAGAGAQRGRVAWGARRRETADIIRAYDVRGATPDTAAAALSGGNQQKFVLGRAVRSAPNALVVESPSRGLDVRAAAAIHEALRTQRDAGAAIVVTTPDLDELLALADRVLVCHAGRVREVASELGAIGRAMLGAD
jgi:ABC-type uncharacterized transport system ATPase subunit